ncbi:hypothetical protein AMTRI_Chr02g215790 [Amborella trichopoda]
MDRVFPPPSTNNFLLASQLQEDRPSRKRPPSPPKLPFIGNLHQISPLLHRSLRDLSEEAWPFHARLSPDTRVQTVNLSHLFLLLTIRGIFGGSNRFHLIIKENKKLLGAFYFGDFFPWMGKNFRKFDDFFKEILHDHEEPHCKSSPGEQQKEDLIDVLLELQMDETLEFHLTRDNIKAIIMDIFGAGADSTTNALAWAMAELIRNPKAMEKAQNEVRRIAGTREMLNGSDMQEVCYLKLVIHRDSTTLPYSSSTNPRETLATCTVNGYEIATETRVIINAWAIGTDPDYWGCSEEFIPERFTDSPMDYKGNDFKYIPFGAGRRGCPGISFGLASFELALANLLLHFEWKLPPGTYAMDMTKEFPLGALAPLMRLRLKPWCKEFFSYEVCKMGLSLRRFFECDQVEQIGATNALEIDPLF